MKKLILLLMVMLCSVISYAQVFTFVAEEYPPYEYLNAGKIDGHDVEMLREAAKIAGFEFQIKFVPWERALAMMKNGSADGIFCLGKNAEREEFLHYPATPLNYETVKVFANSTFTDDITSLEQLKNQTIGMMAGYSYGDDFDNLQPLNKDESNNQEEMFKKLVKNRYQLVVSDELVGWSTIKEYNFEGLKTCSLVISKSPQYIGISKKSPNAKLALSKVEEGMKKILESGKWDEINKKYK